MSAGTQESVPLPRDTPASSPPSAFGPYRVVHQVGAGVLGPVFRGYDPEHDRAVAIKAFSLDLTPEQARDLAADLGRLPGASLKHPSIIAPIAAGAEGSTAYLVQEYFVAESADVALKQYGPAPVPDAMRLIGQLAGALDFAAAAGVHHGALHPRDILVAPHEVRLSGLGVVEALERVGYRTSVRRPYSAPERGSGVPVASQADVFSLAGVSYELLTGRRPSPAGDAVSVELDAIPSADAGALAEVFARALSARADDRFSSSLAFAAALKHALTGEPLVAGGEPAERPKTRRAPRAAARKDASEARTIIPVPTSDATPSAAETDEPPVAPGASDRPAQGATTDAVGGLPLGEAAPRDLPDVPELLPVEPPPGSTPLPSFLESYRPAMEEAPASVFRPADDTPPADPESVPPAVPPAAPTTGLDLDLDALDRRTELTAAVPLPSYGSVIDEPALPPQAVAAPDPVSEEGDRRGEPTLEVPAPRRRRGARSEPPPDEPAQPPLRLDEPDRHDHPAMEPAMFGSEPPAVRSREPRSINSIASHLGMLLVGILLGFPLAYMTLPRVMPASAPASSGGLPLSEAPAGQPIGSAVVQPPAAAPQAPPSVPPPAIEASSPAPGLSTVAPPAAAPPRVSASPMSAPRGEEPAVGAKRRAAAPAPAARRPAQATKTATAAAGVPAAARPASSARFEGSLIVASKPDGAAVQLDGRTVGTTPMTLKAISAGAHAIRLELAGYQIWSSSVQVTAGKLNKVTASLERRPGG